MCKIFNVSGDCKPDLHYMVNIEERLHEMKGLIDKGEYFSMNRARQYGKTTTLRALRRFLQKDYLVVTLDFQNQMSDAKFRNENSFSVAFAKAFLKSIRYDGNAISESMQNAMNELSREIQHNRDELELVELFEYLSAICAVSGKPIVMMIDEVDSATNNQVFLDFLAQLRGYFIDRDVTPTFQSVILAGVYDIRNLRIKLRPEDEHKRNSPWNIAAEFNVDMNFSVEDIAGMLREYENDYKTNMDIYEMATAIYDYTSGYPFLVSKICKNIDEKIAGSTPYYDKKSAWTREGFLEAVKLLLLESNPLFESLVSKLTDYPELRDVIYSLLFNGKRIPFNLMNKPIEIAAMFGFIKNSGGMVVVANRIFETLLYNLFLSEEVVKSSIYGVALQEKNQFVLNGKLNMDLVMHKFVQHFTECCCDSEEKFIEESGRRLFLLYLKPIINGIGNYYIESRTRDLRRTDVIVDYLGEQFVIEMRIWHGDEYNRRGEAQLAGYLDDYHLKKGYLLSFNFNKNKQIGVTTIHCGDKVLVEAVV